MLIDVLRPDLWDELNEDLKSYLGHSLTKIHVRAYHGLPHAIFETCKGTALHMAHKKIFGFVDGQTDAIRKQIRYFYREGYEVHQRQQSEMTDVKAWVEALPKETCFVIFTEDHPVTGEVYKFADELDELLNKKRIHSFRISHANHFYDNIPVRPFTVRICSYTADCAVALLGERYKSPALMAEDMDWNKDSYIKELQEERTRRSVNRILVEDFERQVTGKAQPFFSVDALRIYDRAVVSFNDVSAKALGDLLIQKLSLSCEEGWKQISTTNSCHWGGMGANHMFRKWWHPEPSSEVLRGLLVFNIEILQTKDFANMLLSSYEDLKQQQSWSV